jgi:regulator of replication initiation timing
METEGYWRNEYKKLELQLRETYAQVNYYVNENTKLREENVVLRDKLGISEQSV